MAPRHVIFAVFGCVAGSVGFFAWSPNGMQAPQTRLNVASAEHTSLDYGPAAPSQSRELHVAEIAAMNRLPDIKENWSTLIENEVKKEDSNHDEANRLLGDWLKAAPDAAIDYILKSARDVDFIWINGTVSEYFQNEDGYPGKMSMMAKLAHDPRIPKELLATALVAWARDDHTAALHWLNHASRTPAREDAAVAIGSLIGGSGRAREILEKADLASLDPKIRTSYLSSLIRNWSNHDLVNASEWMNHNIQQPEMDGAIPELVANSVFSNVEFAMIWAESIRDEELRASTILKTANVWQQRDRDAYLQWKQKFVSQNVNQVGAPPIY